MSRFISSAILVLAAAFGAQSFASKATGTDSELTQRVRNELMKQSVSAQTMDVSVVTIDGKATLQGVVPDESDKIVAGKVARDIVPNAVNNIEVRQ